MSRGAYCPSCGHRIRALTPQDVISIRHRAANGEKHEAIAMDLQISRAAVGQIASGKRWRHIAGTRSERPKPEAGVTPPQFARNR